MRSVKVTKKEEYQCMELASRVELIQQLIPLGLMKVKEELEQEVERLATGGEFHMGKVRREFL